ncbi:MAG: alpha/beta hydrolase [Lacisediminihabitans sp.]
MTVDIFCETAPGPSGSVPVRVYHPADPTDGLLWVHGGAFSGGDIDMPESDWVARSLAALGHLVVTVDYRLASASVRYPVPSDDVLAAWSWFVQHATELGIAKPPHLGGASAGGNLATGATIRIRDHDPVAGDAPLPASLVLAYPTLHAVQPTASAELAMLLEGERWSADQVMEMYEAYVPGAVVDAPTATIPGATDPTGLPAIIVVSSEADGLRASAEGFVASLAAHRVPYEYFCEPGTQHGHLNRPEEPAATATIERFHNWLTNSNEPLYERQRP